MYIHDHAPLRARMYDGERANERASEREGENERERERETETERELERGKRERKTKRKRKREKEMVGIIRKRAGGRAGERVKIPATPWHFPSCEEREHLAVPLL